MRVLIQCGDNLENSRRVLALAVLLRRNGHRPIIGVYTKNYIAPFESLGIDVLPLAKFRPRLLGLNRSREIGFEPDAMDLMPVAISNAEFDGNEGIEGWEMRAAISHLVAARRALFQSGADALVVWNGVTGHFANAFRCLKRELNLPGGFLERGLLSDGIYFDPEGTNGWASTARGAELGSHGDRAERSARHRAAVDFHFPSLVQETYMAHARRERSKTIFVPLQVQRDSNILLHSKHVKTMRQLVVEAINLRDRHFPDYRILVRPHPEEDPEETLNLPIAKGTHITSQGNLNDILSDSEVTVTVNSTVGLEAALYGNLPIVYGEGIYTREPFVFRCDTGADGSPAEQLKFLREAPEQVWQQVSDFMIALLDRNLVQPLRCTVSDPEQLLKSFPVADLQVLPARSPYLEKARAEFEQVEGMVHCHVLSSDFPPTNLDYRRMRSVPTSSDLNRMLGAILMTDKQFLAKRGAWSSAFHVAIADEDVSQETTSNYKIVFTPSFGLHPSFLKANCLVLSS